MLKGKTNSNEPVYVELINAIGQRMYSETITPENGVVSHTIEVRTAAGVYMLKAGDKVIRMVVE